MLFLFFAQEKWLIATTVSLIGFACANVFSILLSYALQTVLAKVNSISGLLMMGVAGGSFIPLLMGITTETVHSQAGTVAVTDLVCSSCSCVL